MMEDIKITKCLNCGTEFEGNFCPNCGQPADTKRFTIKFIFTNLLKAILSNDGGIWITLKSLFIRPGQMIVDILDGKRKSYFSPFPMLFLALSLYVVIFTFTGSKTNYYESLVNENKEEVTVDSEELTGKQMMAEKIRSYVLVAAKLYSNNYTAIYILTIPIYILAARVCFGKRNRKKYNWGEYCIPIVYSSVLLVLYRCLMSIVFYFSPELSEKMDDLIIILNIIVFTACFRKMFDFKVAKMVWRSFLTIVFYGLFLAFIVCLAAIIVAIVLIATHPEYFR